MKTKSTSFGFKERFINAAFIEHLLYTEYSTKCYWKISENKPLALCFLPLGISVII